MSEYSRNLRVELGFESNPQTATCLVQPPLGGIMTDAKSLADLLTGIPLEVEQVNDPMIGRRQGLQGQEGTRLGRPVQRTWPCLMDVAGANSGILAEQTSTARCTTTIPLLAITAAGMW